MTPVEELQRWADSGGIWRVLERGPDGLVVQLLMCTGSEEVGRVVSDDPALRAHVGDRDSSEDPGAA